MFKVLEVDVNGWRLWATVVALIIGLCLVLKSTKLFCVMLLRRYVNCLYRSSSDLDVCFVFVSCLGVDFCYCLHVDS